MVIYFILGYYYSLKSIKVIHPRISKYHIEGRVTKLQQSSGIDWATAEALAFGSLLKEGDSLVVDM